MSLLEIYRRNANNKRNEIARLQNDKATETKKIASITSRINAASKAIKKTSSTSTLNSKTHEIERLQNEQARVEKKISDLDIKIAKKNNELSKELDKISKEELKEQQNRDRESKAIQNSNSSHFSNIDNTLKQHSEMHKETAQEINKLKAPKEVITVLYLASNPIDQKQLRLDEEARLIQEMIRKSDHRESVKFETRWAIQPMDVLQAINEVNPTIIHFSGHGSPQGEIVFQDDQGYTKCVNKEAIVQTMAASSNDIRLVFFNTCFSYGQAKSVIKNVEAAIGMNSSIGDEAARKFAAQFYSAIGFGKSLKVAFEQAKALLMLENIPEENIPQLYVTNGIDPMDIIIVKPNGYL